MKRSTLPLSLALLAAAACESRPKATAPAPETNTQALAAAPASQPASGTAAATAPAAPPPLSDAERADHAAYAKEAGKELRSLQADDKQWTTPGKDFAGTRYSTLKEITPGNVAKMKVAWSMDTGANKGHEGAPLVVGSTLYAHSSYPNHVYAVDLTKPDHPVKWKYTPEQDDKAVPVACCDLVHRGLNYAEGKILMITLDSQVIALDANTGKEVWKVKNGDPAKGETITGAGLVVDGKFIVGISGGEFGVRGHISAYDVRNGKRLWRAYSTGPDEELLLADNFNAANPHYGQKEQGTKTWSGDAWKQGGGTTWGWYSYDPGLDLLYYSTGNPGTWNADQRPGDNKWSMTIWARNPETGKASWAYQMTPHDSWDYDGVNESVLVDLSIGGKQVPALVHFDRNGFAYTLDRRDGTILVAEPFAAVNWAKGIDKKTGRPIEDINKRTKQGVVTKDICPNAMGGKDQQPVAYSPRTGLFYVPSNNMCMDYEGTEVKYVAGAPYVGANVNMKPGPGGNLGEVLAWDATTGTKKWGIKEKFPAWSGVLATATDLIFYGTMDGWFKAVNAQTGKVLWQQKLDSGIIGAPMTFEGPDKKQYVAIYSGVGGWFGLPVSNDLPRTDPYAALGAVGIADKSGLYEATAKGGKLYVFSI
ncbi:MAG TPA: methanol/ethanol family PQQ-dependent dehydrogenase [Polyangiaceae bacterium]|nr:methanol/ethanol family PQQ-dependent dehydrogenase [Polyangiaceae bacterium]